MKPYRIPIRSWRTALVAALLVAGGQVVTQTVAATPVLAVTGLQRVSGTPTADNSTQTKIAFAECPTTKHVVGGGVVINDHGQRRAFVSAMLPVAATSPTVGDRYFAHGRAPVGFTGSWSMQAFAVCANKGALPGWEIVRSIEPDASSTTFRQFNIACPGTKRAIGGGGSIDGGGQEVGLQAFRTSSQRDVVRVYGHEDADGYAFPWRLQAVAICTNLITDVVVQSSLQPGTTATQLCPAGKFVHGPGAGAGDGPVFLQAVLPSANLRQLQVTATAPSATGVLTHFTCAA
jgi:hypothetical protein